MSPDDDVYLTVTPFGTVKAIFPCDFGFELDGPADAVSHIRRVMRLATNGQGQLISEGNVEPEDYYYFCQPPGSFITIFPPFGVKFETL